MQQRAVVTGANSGIGLATALRLAADGYEVWAGARSDNGLAAIEESAGSHLIRPVRLDVTDDDSVADAFATVLARLAGHECGRHANTEVGTGTGLGAQQHG